MSFNYGQVFLFSPALLLDVGVQMVVPSLSALLAYTAWKILRDVAPVSCSVFIDQLHHDFVLFLRLHHIDFLPRVL